MNLKITKNGLEKAKACYRPEQLDALNIPAEGATLAQIRAASHIPAEDRLWALTHALIASNALKEQEIVQIDKIYRKFAFYCAKDALKRIKGNEELYNAISNFIEVAEKFHRGEASKEKLDKAQEIAYNAYYAAYDVAYDAAYYAAYNSAYDAAYAANAAYLAAYHAADEAAYWAAYWAADYAAYKAAFWAAYRTAYWAADYAANRTTDSDAAWQKYLDKLIDMLESA